MKRYAKAERKGLTAHQGCFLAENNLNVVFKFVLFWWKMISVLFSNLISPNKKKYLRFG
jgi:hypothetical protein